MGQTESDRAYADVPRASENILGVFGGDRIAKLSKRLDEHEEERRRERGG